MDGMPILVTLQWAIDISKQLVRREAALENQLKTCTAAFSETDDARMTTISTLAANCKKSYRKVADKIFSILSLCNTLPQINECTVGVNAAAKVTDEMCKEVEKLRNEMVEICIAYSDSGSGVRSAHCLVE